MNTAKEKLVSWLFETKALRVCPQDKLFWYTSGTIGPYYINTHFLYGNEEKANELLSVIDREKDNIFTCPDRILELTQKNYSRDNIFKKLVDTMCRFIKDNINLSEVECISGGERRDWFFSLIIAHLLNKPHITIYKDLKAVISYDNKTQEIDSLNGAKVLHIADLVTEASSYERAWIPAVKNKGGEIKWSVVVVDRKQGGEELLSSKGIIPYSMVDVDKSLFQEALSQGLINDQQYTMILNYIDNPKESMKRFLEEHPEFLHNALNTDEKTKERAKMCIEKNIYGLIYVKK